MMTKLIQVVRNPAFNYATDVSNYSLKELWINKDAVSLVSEDLITKQKLSENKLPDGLREETVFSKIFLINGNSIVVVGTPGAILEKLYHGSKELLRG